MISTLQICCVLKISAEIQIQYQKLPLTAKRFCCKPIIYIGLVFAVDIRLPSRSCLVVHVILIVFVMIRTETRSTLNFETVKMWVFFLSIIYLLQTLQNCLNDLDILCQRPFYSVKENDPPPQIAIICWANAGILSAVLLARRRQMTLARCHFAHRANLIGNRWFEVGPTPVAQQALHMPT